MYIYGKDIYLTIYLGSFLYGLEMSFFFLRIFADKSVFRLTY